jgi:hypothetical protein
MEATRAASLFALVAGRATSLIVSAACWRASSYISPITFGRPPGLPLWPFLEFAHGFAPDIVLISDIQQKKPGGLILCSMPRCKYKTPSSTGFVWEARLMRRVRGTDLGSFALYEAIKIINEKQ